MTTTSKTGSRARNSFLVAVGIFCSRLTGLVRQRVIAHYFGLELEADAWAAAFRIPNFLQNLFGEGALSASFIPVYARFVARGEGREADRVAGAVASLLALIVSAIVLVGVLATPLLIFGRSTALPRLAELLAWGTVAGSLLQFAVQLPAVRRVAPDLRFALDTA